MKKFGTDEEKLAHLKDLQLDLAAQKQKLLAKEKANSLEIQKVEKAIHDKKLREKGEVLAESSVFDLAPERLMEIIAAGKAALNIEDVLPAAEEQPAEKILEEADSKEIEEK